MTKTVAMGSTAMKVRPIKMRSSPSVMRIERLFMRPVKANDTDPMTDQRISPLVRFCRSPKVPSSKKAAIFSACSLSIRARNWAMLRASVTARSAFPTNTTRTDTTSQSNVSPVSLGIVNPRMVSG